MVVEDIKDLSIRPGSIEQRNRNTKIRKTNEERNELYAFVDYRELWGEGLGMRKFALTRSNSSSRVECSLGKRPL